MDDDALFVKAVKIVVAAEKKPPAFVARHLPHLVIRELVAIGLSADRADEVFDAGFLRRFKL